MTLKSTKPIVLVDGSSYLYRAFHALPPLTNSRGEPTGAIYGVVNMLRKLINDYQPEFMAVIFDAKGKTFRDELFTEYKAHRPPMPDELRLQIEPLHAVIKALGLPLLIIDGVEADDVIGTLAYQATLATTPIIISTGDKDMAQLVNDHVTLINTMSGQVLNPLTVEEKFGIPPELIVDYLSLMGDSVDNIPGIPNVGPKTAVKWLKEFGSLENIMQRANEIKGKVGDNLRAHIHQLPLAKQLTTIRLDVPLTQTLSDLQRLPMDSAALLEWYKRLEFKSWLAELLDQPSQQQQAKQITTDYQTIFTEEEFNDWLQRLKSAKHYSFDTETTSLDYMQAQLVGISIAITSHQAAYIPVAHDYLAAPTQLSRDFILQKLKPLLEDTQPKKIGHNLKYDMTVMANHGIRLQGIAYDTMLESYVLDSTATRHDMDTLALKYLGHKTISFTDVAGKGAQQLTFNQVPIEQATAYAAEDADITLQLHEHIWPMLSKQVGLVNTLMDIEIPLIPVLSALERNGVLIDANLLHKQSQELAERIDRLQNQAYTLADEEFNLGSPKQLQEILFNKLQLPILQKTPTGQPSTGEDVLQELALDYPLPKVILEYRSLSKLKSTYTDRLPEQINPNTGRVHTSYHQAVTATGRLSSSDPNLQNIPIRTEEGRRIRKAFIAAPGYKIVAADYSQIELRIMAHFSQDPGLLHAFANDIDIHKATAAEVFGVSLDKVTPDQRRSAKAINFGLIYGMSAFGLAKQLGVERQAAQQYMERYFTRYPGVSNYMETTRKKAHDLGYVEGLFGRRLYLPEINSRNMQRQKSAERAAINAPLQGTAADIIKKAMISVHQWLEQAKIPAHMILQVHDELVFEVAESALPNFSQEIQEHMTQAVDLAVPLIVEVGIGNNWDEAH